MDDQLGKRLEGACIKAGVGLLVIGSGAVCVQTMHLWGAIEWRTWAVGTLLAPGKFLWSLGMAKIMGHNDEGIHDYFASSAASRTSRSHWLLLC